jgi:outer membrane immunogenic protein
LKRKQELEMKRIFLMTAAIVALVAGSASAADLPAAYKAAPPPPTCAQFGGFYVGANIGYAQYKSTHNDLDSYIEDGSFGAVGNGAAGGVQGGYNWQSRCTVYGFEADYSWAQLKANSVISPSDPTETQWFKTKVDGFGTFRARGGIVVDQTLLYLTAGAAYARVKTDIFKFESDDGQNERNFFSDNRWGYAVGAGLEHAVANNWTVKAEALYMGFGDRTNSFFSPAETSNIQFKSVDSVFVARIGANWRFGG